jgi:antitoxin HigA-1
LAAATSPAASKRREYPVRRPLQRLPTHPGALMREILEEHVKLTIAEAARRMKVSRQALHAVLNGTATVTVEMALRFARLTGGAPKLYLDIQVGHDLEVAQQRLHDELAGIDRRLSAIRRRRPARVFPKGCKRYTIPLSACGAVAGQRCLPIPPRSCSATTPARPLAQHERLRIAAGMPLIHLWSGRLRSSASGPHRPSQPPPDRPPPLLLQSGPQGGSLADGNALGAAGIGESNFEAIGASSFEPGTLVSPVLAGRPLKLERPRWAPSGSTRR